MNNSELRIYIYYNIECTYITALYTVLALQTDHVLVTAGVPVVRVVQEIQLHVHAPPKYYISTKRPTMYIKSEHVKLFNFLPSHVTRY